ncbi:MAG TPA: elongation factor P maturation arginine rhamnosyltransferase EarP [Rectinemataceae bacterium]|nr:elongation factor P maturation arginine rhamnosyltransferase EarP [Rectinemataceae bacterium]
MTIDILCKVVDNFGDIGVAYRLAKALTDLDPSLALRLHVDDLVAFHALCPEVEPGREVQVVRGWTVLRWNADWAGLRERPPRAVLECFACGRPERFEEILYDSADPEPRYVVNIEHLTAESWAADFHLLPSATRSGLVRKWMFMPGFSEGTGGLIIDRRFREARESALALDGRAGGRAEGRARLADELAALGATLGAAATTGAGGGATALGAAAAPGAEGSATALGAAAAPGAEPARAMLRDLAGRRWVSVFSYERDYGRVVEDLAAADRERPLAALAAAGRSQACFLAAWEAAGRPFPVLVLPFLPQEVWDEVILASDFSIVRGEESLARAALSGRPFLWHAYLQDGKHQLVKVRALLDRLRPQFGAADFGPVEEAFLAFNDRERDEPATAGRERISPFLAARSDEPFRAFAEGLAARGDLAAHLMTFLGKIR